MLLEGITVLDLTRAAAGPACTRTLAAARIPLGTVKPCRRHP